MSIKIRNPYVLFIVKLVAVLLMGVGALVYIQGKGTFQTIIYIIAFLFVILAIISELFPPDQEEGGSTPDNYSVEVTDGNARAVASSPNVDLDFIGTLKLEDLGRVSRESSYGTYTGYIEAVCPFNNRDYLFIPQEVEELSPDAKHDVKGIIKEKNPVVVIKPNLSELRPITQTCEETGKEFMVPNLKQQ